MAEADISNDLQNTSAALGNFQTSLNSLASSMAAQNTVANKVARASGEYIPKWKYEDDLKDVVRDFGAVKGEITELQVVANGHRYNII